MERTFYCFPNDAAGQPIIGTTHRWTVEDSTLALDLEHTMQNCPFHDGLPNNEAPEQHGPVESRGV